MQRRALLILCLGFPALAPAQDLAAHPWAAWFGCWAPIQQSLGERPVTCVVPAESEAPAVEIITVVGGTLVRQTNIAADGVHVPFDQHGCAGWDAAQFSADGSRVYLSGEITCGSRATQLTSGVYALAPGGEWLDIHVVRTGEERTVRSQRLELLPLSILPADLQEDFALLERVATSARAAALSSPLNVAQVIEVSARVDAAAAEIWLIESAAGAAQPLRLHRAELLALSSAAVPDRVVDAAVAVANPSHFIVDVAAGEGLIAQVRRETRGGAAPLAMMQGNAFSRCALGVWNDLYFQPSAFVMFMGFNAPFQYQWPYDANCFNPYFGRGWFNQTGRLGQVVFLSPQPVTPTVTPKHLQPPTPRAGSTYNGGRVVSGQGYKAPSSGGTATPASSTGSGTGTSSGSSSGSSGRTAKPRNP